MSQSNTDSSQDGNSEFSVQYDYEIECSGMSRETVLDIEDVVDESGIRAEKFAFTHTEESQPAGPLIRLKGLKQDAAEDVVANLRENGITEVVDDSLTIVILPTDTA